MRVPLSAVMAWPDDHVRLQLAFLEREPPAEDRIEMAIAALSALTFNVNRGRNTNALSFSDFLPADPWAPRTGAGLTPEELKLMGYLDSQPP